MEDNNDTSSASALETQPIGETGGEVSAIFGDGNDVMQGDSSKSEVPSTVLYLSCLSLILTVEQYR